MCYKRQGKVDEAIELWKKMLEQSPGASSGAYGLAETYLERNEFDKALPLYEKLAKEMPDNETVQAGLARAKEGAKR
jgi:predicted Zn-dependent protease